MQVADHAYTCKLQLILRSPKVRAQGCGHSHAAALANHTCRDVRVRSPVPPAAASACDSIPAAASCTLGAGSPRPAHHS
jgi:hypothetical protein